jgi:hypothetical protein
MSYCERMSLVLKGCHIAVTDTVNLQLTSSVEQSAS